MLIRRELPGDESAIRRVHADAFAPHYQGEPPVEPQLVDDLRASGAHLEHVLVKLGAPTRTLAAVRAERDGIYVPASSRRRACGGQRESIGTT